MTPRLDGGPDPRRWLLAVGGTGTVLGLALTAGVAWTGVLGRSVVVLVPVAVLASAASVVTLTSIVWLGRTRPKALLSLLVAGGLLLVAVDPSSPVDVRSPVVVALGLGLGLLAGVRWVGRRSARVLLYLVVADAILLVLVLALPFVGPQVVEIAGSHVADDAGTASAADVDPSIAPGDVAPIPVGGTTDAVLPLLGQRQMSIPYVGNVPYAVGSGDWLAVGVVLLLVPVAVAARRTARTVSWSLLTGIATAVPDAPRVTLPNGLPDRPHLHTQLPGRAQLTRRVTVPLDATTVRVAGRGSIARSLQLPSRVPGWLRTGRVVYVASVVLLVLVVAPFVVYLLPGLVGASNSYVVVSGSMAASPAPVIEAGDVVFVHDTPPERIASGDVITYRTGDGQVTTHRVVGVDTSEGHYFRTQGDANEEADPSLVPAERVVGTVGLTVPFVGHVVVFAGTTAGFVTMVAIPLFLLLVFEVRDVVAATRTGVARDAPSASPTPPESVDDFPPAVDTSDEVTYTLTRTDLRLTLVVLTAFVAYSGYVAVRLHRQWATIVTVTVVVSLALLGAVYLYAGWDGEAGSTELQSATDGGSPEPERSSASGREPVAAPPEGGGEG